MESSAAVHVRQWVSVEGFLSHPGLLFSQTSWVVSFKQLENKRSWINKTKYYIGTTCFVNFMLTLSLFSDSAVQSVFLSAKMLSVCHTTLHGGFSGGAVVKNPPANAEDTG